ncbi:hypothetical protein SAY87_027006 [Trapa incisa]|uniref:BHLH domain-containing protein n=1 Tax=Trapa incisa TaxID=236973 RepID=A0AAN7JLR5_9MYRT|nr:hypothetical protein SAY87_027006 [Trapa incisa]
MAGSGHEGLGDDFLEQIIAGPSSGYAGAMGYSRGGEGGGEEGDVGHMHMVLQLGSGAGISAEGGGGGIRMLPLGLNLEQSSGGLLANDDGSGSGGGRRYRNSGSPASNSSVVNMDGELVHNMAGLYPAFGQLQPHPFQPPPLQPVPTIHQPFESQQTGGMIPASLNQPAIRPRVRARRGQATDPHSIAERLRRERIAERMKALQELVPSCNKSDRAAMLDEIVDYVKFLRLQVKVLSMSRLGGTGAVAQLVAGVPLSSFQGDSTEIGNNSQPAWEKWSTDGTEQQVAKLMEEDMGAAMQFLQSKALCIMPISLASAIFNTNEPDTQILTKPESNASV